MVSKPNWLPDSVFRRSARDADESSDTAHVLQVPAVLLLTLVLGGAITWLCVSGRPLFVIPLLLVVLAAIVFLRYPFAGVLIWLAIYPFFVKDSTSIGFYAHWALYRLLIPGMLWVVLMSYWAKLRPMPRFKFGVPEWAMLLFLVWAAGNALLLSHDAEHALIRLYDRAFVPFCMYLLIRLLNPTPRDLKRLLPVAVVILLVQVLVGLAAWFAPQYLPPEWLGAVGQRTVGTLGNPAAYTTTLILFGLILFQYAMQSASALPRLLSIALFCLAAFCVFFSFSRGSWFAGALVCLGLLLVYPQAVLRGTLIVALVIFFLSTSVLSDALAFANERLNTEHTAESRLVTNAASLRMINAEPWFGWGYDNYDQYNAQFKFDVGDISAADNVNTSHNTYLTIGAELGIPALVLYLIPTLWWLGSSVVAWSRLPRSGFWSRSLLALLWLALLAEFTVSSFMDMIRYNLFGTMLWWIALGLIAVMVTSSNKAQRNEVILHDPGDSGMRKAS